MSTVQSADRATPPDPLAASLGPEPSAPALADAFDTWLEARREAHAPLREMRRSFEERSERVRALQRELFDAGWARIGWPVALGGLGGSVLHRAVILDRLSRAGYPGRFLLEHLEILPPALAAHATPALTERLFLPTLRGDILWCQGFSEPGAGSDLAALRTRAEPADDGFRIHGHKIWTSWAQWASHVLLLARTGATEDRHRGLSAFVVELDTPGVRVSPIRQANGTDELAEVFFEDVHVPAENLVGEMNGGWAVAMHILAGERGSYGWLRQAHLLPVLERLATHPGAAGRERELGSALVGLLAVRCRAREVLEILARGEQPGPESSVAKVLIMDAEQALFDTAREVLGPDLALGGRDDAWEWQEGYLYSRASSIYGGARQIQLNVIGKLMVRSGESVDPRPRLGEDERVVRTSVRNATAESPSGRIALAGLDWWSLAASPRDGIGRAAFSAWFEEQGATLGTSPALAGVAASAVALALEEPAEHFAWAERRAATSSAVSLSLIGWDESTRWVAVTEIAVAGIAVTGGNLALAIVPTDAIQETDASALDPGLVRRAIVPPERLAAQSLPDGAQAQAVALARIGAAFEILGAATALTDQAVRHTNERHQFGQPLSAFQALQHLLSECQVDLAALSSLCDAALEEWSAGEATELAAAAKAWAGGAGRRIAQRTLQCFGAVAFTDEHSHHRYSRRIHTLDALLGSGTRLEQELGASIHRTGRAPLGIEAWRPGTTPASNSG
ncbi:MAG: acyl-CoA dehydrogenase family protein [Deltaproteobacteria bacterium]|nr:acyl-CoA dehydrogenase family protein [Deltaproteobacteria bacterium]MBW2393584.1 acyl-CoA dehydrogenase family protein [Deltaproteobacteria bacterium]